MKNKKMIAVVVVFALLQMMFPGAVIVYERCFMNSVIEKGEIYTLEYSGIEHFNRDSLTVSKYKVEIRGDHMNKNVLTWSDAGYNYEVIAQKDENGKTVFYPLETEGMEATDDNLFCTVGAFSLDFEDYEFVLEDFGMKEFFEVCIYLCRDSDRVESFEEFIDPEYGYSAIYDIDLDGKAVISVYKGMAIIKEFYIGDELVLRHK